MIHRLQFQKNVHYLQEVAAADAVDTVVIAAAVAVVVAAVVHSVAAVVVIVAAVSVADHVVVAKVAARSGASRSRTKSDP